MDFEQKDSTGRRKFFDGVVNIAFYVSKQSIWVKLLFCRTFVVIFENCVKKYRAFGKFFKQLWENYILRINGKIVSIFIRKFFFLWYFFEF